MHISRVDIKNFRLLRNTSIVMREDLSLLIGKNNSGKTSILVLFDKFLSQPNSFSYNDFSIALRDKILTLDSSSDIDDLSIRMVLEIIYDENDHLENLSEFILDLDPDIKSVKLLFECNIEKDTLLKEVSDYTGDERKRLIIKNLDKHLKSCIYVFDDSEHTGTADEFFKSYRHKLISKHLKDVRKLINFQFIAARRNVHSSEESATSKKPLSLLTTEYFNSFHDVPNEDLAEINQMLLDLDSQLGEKYHSFFEGFLDNSRSFLNLNNLSVVSNIQSKMLLDHSSQVIYGSDDNHLPEHLNGLGFMNILYLLLIIEIKKVEFIKHGREINILCIEEPEAHTHPQMQYIFADRIKTVLKEIDGLQTLITSHSPHIVSQSDFEDIRYLKIINENEIQVKNFYAELAACYEGKQEQFKFLKQYLNIQSAELFFASKVIFIEGITERMLLPYFIQKYDEEHKSDDDYIPIVSQNISILEVGANAKVFAPFLEFLDVKTLVITDIDTTIKKIKGKNTVYDAVEVQDSTHTSNASLKYFLDAPDITSEDFTQWFNHLLEQKLPCIHQNVLVAYQKLENDYHARSFEDAFININKDRIKQNKDKIDGLKNKSKLSSKIGIYELTNSILDKKSDFAASILYLGLCHDDITWEMPLYIREGLEWIQK